MLPDISEPQSAPWKVGGAHHEEDHNFNDVKHPRQHMQYLTLKEVRVDISNGEMSLDERTNTPTQSHNGC